MPFILAQESALNDLNNRTGSGLLHDLSTGFGWKYRLHRTTEFEAVFADKTHRPIHTPLFVLRRRDNQFGHPRLGVAVSRRTSKKAVHRNRIKRRVKETFRQQRRELPNMDFVVTCTRAVGPGTPASEVSASLLRLWREAAAHH